MVLDRISSSEQQAPTARTTPRYLFRVWSPNSDGENSEVGFKSLGCVKTPLAPRRLNDLDHEKARHMIMHHVAWTSKKDCHDDVLISFTSSLLFAIQHAIRKINTSFPSNPDTPENCFLTVVDAAQLEQTLHKTTTLVKEYAISTADWSLRNITFQRPQHEHEYLAEWAVNLQATRNGSCTVNIGLLMEKGIGNVVPQLEVDYQKYRYLHESLIKFLNHTRGRRYSVATSISFEELTAIGMLAACFTGRWQRIMRVWFMALSRRKVDDRAVCDTLKRSWNDKEDIFEGYYQPFIPDPKIVTEECEFIKLMTLGAAFAHQRRSADGLLPDWTPHAKAGPARPNKDEHHAPPAIVASSSTVVSSSQEEAKIARIHYDSLEEMMRESERSIC